MEPQNPPKKNTKTHDKTTEKNNQRGRKKYIACKIIFFTFFFGPMGLRETRAHFFQRTSGVCSKFSRNKRLWTELCNFFWWFPFYHFDILLAVLMNWDVIFYLGLEIKPCESRLEFAHPQKIKTQKNKWQKTDDGATEKNYQRGRKKYIASKINFFTFFFAYGSRGNLANFFSFIFPVSWILRENFNC